MNHPELVAKKKEKAKVKSIKSSYLGRVIGTDLADSAEQYFPFQTVRGTAGQ